MHVPSPARGPLLPPPRAAIFDLAAVTELATAAAAAVQAGTDSLAAVSPAVLAPVVSTLGGDVASFVGLQPTLEGSARFFALYYALLARPGPFVGECAGWGGPAGTQVWVVGVGLGAGGVWS